MVVLTTQNVLENNGREKLDLGNLKEMENGKVKQFCIEGRLVL